MARLYQLPLTIRNIGFGIVLPVKVFEIGRAHV
jgi:hypothetical protein